MCKAFNKRLLLAVLHHLAVIVVHIMIDINHRLFYIAHTMAEQIYSHHRIGEALGRVGANVHLVAILRAKILPKAQRLGVEPCLLQFDKHHAVFKRLAISVFLSHGGSKVNTKH